MHLAQWQDKNETTCKFAAWLRLRVTDADKALCPLMDTVCQTVNVTLDTFFCVQRDRDFRDRDRDRDENRRYDRGGVYLCVDACLCGVTNVAGIFVFLMLKICFLKTSVNFK